MNDIERLTQKIKIKKTTKSNKEGERKHKKIETGKIPRTDTNNVDKI